MTTSIDTSAPQLCTVDEYEEEANFMTEELTAEEDHWHMMYKRDNL